MLKLKLQYFGHLMWRANSLEKTLMLKKIKGRRRRGWQDEMVGWHHWLNGHEFEQAPGDGEGQGSLACCSPWGRKELDTTEQLNDNRPLCSQANPGPGEGRQIGCVEALSAMHAAQTQRIGQDYVQEALFSLCYCPATELFSGILKGQPGGPLLLLEDEQNAEWERLVVFRLPPGLWEPWGTKSSAGTWYCHPISSPRLSPGVGITVPTFHMGKLRTGGWSQVPKLGGAQVLGRQHSLGRGGPGRPHWWQRASSLLCLQNPQKDKSPGLTVLAQAWVPRAGPQAALPSARVSEQRHV